jgi:nicotinamidase-related amidase
MRALIVVDAQNEFSATGLRPVPNHEEALRSIHSIVDQARRACLPIAWVRHFNKPHESRAFVPGTWGSELSPGLGPQRDFGPEELFDKDVYGAFSGTGLEAWLRGHGVDALVLVGFYTHMCLSTSAREGLVRGFDVTVDPSATGARDLEHPILGRQLADEVRRAALLHLANMGVVVGPVGAETLREAVASGR